MENLGTSSNNQNWMQCDIMIQFWEGVNEDGDGLVGWLPSY